ncbi:MAG: hypothetical protein KDA45_11955 [Planctomycetales bacterium]|nr:hypothetical protein [Planctomycetales bacterium]
MKNLSYALLLFLLAGCGEESLTVPVEGILRLDGQPLKDVSVMFVPDGSGRDATGSTDDEGRFVLSTFDPRDGAMPGTYKVVIMPAMPVLETPEGATAEEAMQAEAAAARRPGAKPTGPRVPMAYTRLDQTKLTQVVPPEGDIVIDLKSR